MHKFNAFILCLGNLPEAQEVPMGPEDQGAQEDLEYPVHPLCHPDLDCPKGHIQQSCH